GAGILLIEDEEHARKRGARIYAELASYAATADAYHITEPAPGGAGLARAMRRALEKGSIAAEEGQYINAHGTATLYNDSNETTGIKSVFGDHAPRLAVSSTKSMIGHTLGAAGGIETAVTALTIHHGLITPTINLVHPDPECDLDYVPEGAREMKVEVALSNSMGFGGHNAVLALRRYKGYSKSKSESAAPMRCAWTSPQWGPLRRPATERQSLVNRVKALAEALEGSDVGELDLTENGLRIYIRRRIDALIVAAPVAGTRGRRSPTRGSDARDASSSSGS